MTVQRLIRDATPADAVAVAAIYAPQVLQGTATFEMVAPTAGEMRARMAAVQDGGGVWLVLEIADSVVGYAYCRQFHDRPGYRYAAESTVYLASALHRRGHGRALLDALIEAAIAKGFRQLIAVIGDSANAASIGLHSAVGFRHVGTMTRIGRKFGRWFDVVYMQCGIGAGAEQP